MLADIRGDAVRFELEEVTAVFAKDDDVFETVVLEVADEHL